MTDARRHCRNAASALAISTWLVASNGAPAAAIMPLRPDLRDAAAKAGAPASPAMEAARTSGLFAPSPLRQLKTTGEIRALVLAIEFPESPGHGAVRPIEYFENLAFAETGKSLRTYYREASYAQLAVTGSVAGWFGSEFSYFYYVNADATAGTSDDYGFDITSRAFDPNTDTYPRNVWGLVMETAALADGEIDFSDFDNDGDGRVDALFVVHSGLGAEEVALASNANFIWSHKSNLSEYLSQIRQPAFVVDGVEIANYVMIPETGHLGVICHEFGHVLGLPDIYRTDPENGVQESVVGSFDIMDNGGWLPDGRGSTPGHFGAWCKYQLGWIDPIAVETGLGRTTTVPDAQLVAAATTKAPGTFYRVLENPGGADWSPRAPGRGEYFLLENRVAGNGDFDDGLPASGLIVWHVDETRANNNETDADRHLLTLVQSDGEDYRSMGRDQFGEASDLWPGMRQVGEFTSASTPNSDLHGGAFSGVEITEIRRSGEVIEAAISAGGIRFGIPYAYPNPMIMSDGAGAVSFVFKPDAEPSTKNAAAAPIRIRIYDLSGALVNTLSAADSPLIWDCRNASGEMVASGTYFYFVESQGETAEGKIAIIH